MELYQVETLVNTAYCSKVDCDAMHWSYFISTILTAQRPEKNSANLCFWRSEKMTVVQFSLPYYFRRLKRKSMTIEQNEMDPVRELIE